MSRSPGRLRVVFDCNLLVQAVAFENGPAAVCLRLVESGGIELFVSKPILAELRRVLAYEEVLSISPSMTSTRISAFLQRLSFRATLVRRVRHGFDYPRDRKDEPYIDLAIVAKADYLISRDNDLLTLMTGHSSICKQFRRACKPMKVVNPVTFLRAIELPQPFIKKSGEEK